jgi:uncharacterized protein
VIRPNLIVAYGPRGRGVFTLKDIAKGDIVEVAPAVDLADVQGLDEYIYYAPIADLSRIVFGYGMLYAHSHNPNMEYLEGPTSMTYYALRDIAEGDELTINYGDEYWGDGSTVVSERA